MVDGDNVRDDGQCRIETMWAWTSKHQNSEKIYDFLNKDGHAPLKTMEMQFRVGVMTT